MHLTAVGYATAKRSPQPPRTPDPPELQRATTRRLWLTLAAHGAMSVRFAITRLAGRRERFVASLERLKRAAAIGLLGVMGAASFATHSAVILRGSDYFETVQPTFFLPLDALGMGTLNPLQGVPVGPGTTDTVVQRQADCILDLDAAGTACEIPIEMVELRLQSVVNSDVLLRESPTLPSSGSMITSSDGSGTGGTFTSFFDVFVELSLDGGVNWTPLPVVPLAAPPTDWTTVTPTPPTLVVPGLLGDQDANLHTDRDTSACTDAFGPGATCEDFYLIGTIREEKEAVGVHSARPAVMLTEPTTLLLSVVALLLAASRQSQTRRQSRRFQCAHYAVPEQRTFG
jgi:hypothetical protein